MAVLTSFSLLLHKHGIAVILLKPVTCVRLLKTHQGLYLSLCVKKSWQIPRTLTASLFAQEDACLGTLALAAPFPLPGRSSPESLLPHVSQTSLKCPPSERLSPFPCVTSLPPITGPALCAFLLIFATWYSVCSSV